MIHTITKNNWSAQISELGAELKSFKDNHEYEYIWNGNPDIWSGTAPVLFPIVGKLNNNTYKFDGKEYAMNQHGIVRKRNFEVYRKEKSVISFIIGANAETMKVYPFDFELIVEFEVGNGLLTVSYFVINRGERQMYFTIGSHPAFHLNIQNCKLGDYYIEFEKEETIDCYVIEAGLLADKTLPLFLNNEKIIPITKDLFNDDALVFKNIQSNSISIKNDLIGYNLTLKTGGAPHLGIWAKPGAPYVCIEPWFGFADKVGFNDDLSKKEGMLKLKPKESFVADYQIVI